MIKDNLHILQSGEPKSGNYWLFTIIQEIINELGIDQKSYIKNDAVYPIAKTWDLSTDNQVEENVLDITNAGYFYRIGSIYRKPILDLKEYVNGNTHVWTHSPYCQKSSGAFGLFDKVVYIVRDPRDVLLSMAKFSQTPYMKKYYPSVFDSQEAYLEESVVPMAIQWAKNVSQHLVHAKENNIYVLFYERLLSNTKEELEVLLKYLEIDLSEDGIDRILDKVSFSSMKKDNPDHVNKAVLYGWMNRLSDEQVNLFNEEIGEMLSELSYPITRTDSSQLPTLPFKPTLYKRKKKQKEVEKTFRSRLRLIKKALTP